MRFSPFACTSFRGAAAPNYDCTYYTMAQCAAAATGRAAQCGPNPNYTGATTSLRRNNRRYRNVGSVSLVPSVTDGYCLQGRIWGYPGNCQSPTMIPVAGLNPEYAFARQRRGDYRPRH
jgi:Protein of unknown function (DUF3551)